MTARGIARAAAAYERALNPNGVYATLGGHVPRLIQVACSRFRLRRARDRTLRIVGLAANRDLQYFNELFDAGRFKPVIGSVYAFNEDGLREAFHRFATSAHIGKTVIHA